MPVVDIVQLWTGLVVGYAVFMFAKRRMGRRHWRQLRGQPRRERARRLVETFERLLFLALPAAYWENLQAGWREIPGMTLFSLITFGAGFLLHLWSVHSLGTLWTPYCVVFEGMQKVVSGPYRWLRHPEFLGRLLEGVGMTFLLGAYLTGTVYFAAALVLTLMIARQENLLMAERDIMQHAGQTRTLLRMGRPLQSEPGS